MNSNRRTSILGGIVFLTFAGVYFFLADSLPPGGPFDQVGTKFFPKLLGAILAGLSLLLIIATVSGNTPQKESEPSAQVERTAFYGTLAVTFLSLALWKVIGFMSTPLLMAGIMVVNGTRNLRLVVAVVAGVTLLLYLVFFRLFALPLPLGFLE